MKDHTLRRILVFFLLISTILIVVAVQAVRNINRSTATSDWVNHTHAVIMEVEALRTALYVADATVQAYVSTGSVSNLAACNEAHSNVIEHLEIVQALTRNEPEQKVQIDEIATLVNTQLGRIRKILHARQEGRTEDARKLLATDAGDTANPDLQRKIKTLKEAELDLLTARDTASYLQAQATRWTVWSGMALDVLLLVGVVWLIRDDLAARRKVAGALQEANAQLESRVAQRTAELATTNQDLVTENLERQWTNQALEHQLRYNHNIVDSISDLVFVITKVANISRVNPAVLHLTGLESSDLINQPLTRVVQLDITETETNSPLRNPIAQAMKDGRDLREQSAAVKDRNGKLTPVRFSLFPLRDHDKVIGGIVTLQIIPPGSEAKA
ncbi:MAG: CHASE3 domain-containing protein [Cephaloticoccus sp.]|nr:CHASE3 domain-containing protein [Cephaloticoccus sp.]MCF7759538.1 CHASE3 domain-containing protein [Cephaloticoccus sp.]